MSLPTWPMARAGEALIALARRSGLRVRDAEPPRPPPGLDADTRGRWLEETAAWLDLDAEPVRTSFARLGEMLAHGGPLLVSVGDDRLLAVLAGGRRGRVRVLGPDLAARPIDVATIWDALAAKEAAKAAAEVDALLAAAGPTAAGARRAVLGELLGGRFLGGAWLLRPPPGAPLRDLLRHAGVFAPAAGAVLTHVAAWALWLVSWWLLGRGALAGRLDPGWLSAWALVLVTMVPVRMASTALQGLTALRLGATLRRRLLAGALRLGPDEVKSQGVGQVLGLVIESEALEGLVLSGGLLALVSTLELAGATWVLSVGAGGGGMALLAVAGAALAVAAAVAITRRRAEWTEARLRMTHDLVERMVGHRTRLAQEDPATWHEGEDAPLVGYLAQSARVDRLVALVRIGLPRGFLVAALGGVGVALASGAGSGGLAVAVGGTLLAYSALQHFTLGLSSLADAAVAWRRVGPLVRAADRPEVRGAPALAVASVPEGGMLVSAHDVRFAYAGRARPVLDGARLEIRAGDRVLLEGPSGGGKSTLAALLVGLRSADSGLLLLGGLDRWSLGDRGWRRRAVAAPQFHENRIFTGTLAYNLLMGRRWPPNPKDVADAQAVCLELGLGPLLERMPAGVLQMVGESGWQLSHGEQGRVHLARALLQDAELVVLDESFAALDPETLRLAWACARKRAKTLVVVAHP